MITYGHIFGEAIAEYTRDCGENWPTPEIREHVAARLSLAPMDLRDAMAAAETILAGVPPERQAILDTPECTCGAYCPHDIARSRMRIEGVTWDEAIIGMDMTDRPTC